MKDHPFGQTGHTPIFTERVVFVQVKDLMNPSAVTVEPTSSAALAARLISRHNVGALPVCAPDRRLRGMVTDRDIVLRCIAAEEDPAQTPVRDIMTRSCATVAPGDDCREATRLMARHQVRRLPVVEGGRLVGVISLADLARSGRFDMEAAQALCEISENIIGR
jgi:CBS domain-containing protein